MYALHMVSIHMGKSQNVSSENKKVSDNLVCLTCFTIQILHIDTEGKTTYKTTCLLPVQILIHSVKTGNKLEVI